MWEEKESRKRMKLLQRHGGTSKLEGFAVHGNSSPAGSC